MAKRGRIPKITEPAINRFCEAIANGMSRNRAADLIGIHRMTVSRWLRLGRNGEGGKLYAHFAAKIVESEARFIEKNLKSVQRAAAPRRTTVTKTYTRADGSSTTEVTEKVEYDWAAARWLLECKDRESFGPDRAEIAALKKDLTELRKFLGEAMARLRPAGESVNPDGRAGTAEGGPDSPAADLSAGPESGGPPVSAG